MESKEIKPLLSRVEYLCRENEIVAYIRTTERTDVCCTFGGEQIPETSNLREPFDFKLHTVPLPAEKLHAGDTFTLHFTKRGSRPSVYFTEPGQVISADVIYDPAAAVTKEAAEQRQLRGLVYEGEIAAGGCVGIEWCIETYRTPDGAPVRVYTVTADPEKTDFLTGTPNGEPVFREKVIQTVMEEAEEIQKKGRTVLAAFNADFFDMFGDCHPSGLCVSGGTVVANPDTHSPFFGVTKEGKPVIGRIGEYPVHTLREAVGGRQIIVRDGRPCELAPLEPFGEISHPRTAFGITGDGHVLLTVVDGRRPVWSNGASLGELARIMIARGAVIAINVDGGGSSTVIVRKGDGLEMINHPADLVRPMEDLIRPLFDSLIVVAK